MQYLTPDQFLACAKLKRQRFDDLMRLGHVVLAFGAPCPAVAGQYLPLDALALRIADELVGFCGRDLAAAIVASHWPVWTDAAGRSEFDSRAMFFAVWEKIKGGKREFLISGGTP